MTIITLDYLLLLSMVEKNIITGSSSILTDIVKFKMVNR